MPKIKFKMPRSLHDLQHKGEHFFHMSYLAFTYIEGHGAHAITAGVLCLVVFAGVFTEHAGEGIV